MGQLLAGRRGLVMGVANERSLAWSIAQAAHREGAELAFTFGLPQLEKRVRPLAERVGASLVLPCDVQSDQDIASVFAQVGRRWEKLDFLIHAIAFANREELKGLYADTSREGFHLALDVSAYSLVAVTRAALPLMGEGGSIVTLSYLGAERTLPHYNVMGVAKAALEASVRYLAADVGPRGIRVNALSAGPVRTLASAGVGGFRNVLDWYAANAPLRRATNQDEVGDASLLLLSDWGRGITGEVIYVDSGYHIVGVPSAVGGERNERDQGADS
ncbi:MAG: enoyl-ACP reductase [Gaiellales bacterium]|nr:enoyl-ACP reductase [Gaiellales bacterium]